ncbi:MAG: EpsG family protein [Clostridiales bacterium]|nr:EpsG family protein [Clostridiales bacterium]
MSELLPIVIFIFFMALLMEAHSARNIETGEYVRKDIFFCVIMTIVMIAFVGLRTQYNDTGTYIHSYELVCASSSPFSDISWTIGDNFGFNFVNACLASLGVSTQSFLMLYAIVTVAIYVWFIRKYGGNMPACMMLLVVDGGYIFALAAMKQCIAVAFCLIATDCAFRKKWAPFVIWILIAMTFHPYSFLYLVIVLLRFQPWLRRTWYLLGLSLAAGALLQVLVGGIISVTSMLGESYTTESFAGEGVNVFRVMVAWVPVVLSFMVRREIDVKKEPIQSIILNLSMIRAMIMFIALFGTANYFARLANYFSIFPCISIPWLIGKFEIDNRKLLTFAAIAGYTVYFIYGSAFNQVFDNNYARITIGEYVRSFF